MTPSAHPALRRPVLLVLAMLAALVAMPATLVSPAQAATTGRIAIQALHNLPTSTAPVAGAVFTVSRVQGVDPTTAAGRARVEAYRQALPALPPVEAAQQLPATGADGSTEVTGLSTGVYLVHETGVLDASGRLVPPTVRLADFLVALPTLDDQGRPVLDVTVTPKPLPSLPPVPTVTVPPVTVPQVTVPPVTVPPATLAPVPPVTAQVPPTSTHIISGDGAGFDTLRLWATVVAGLALVAAVFLGTRRRRAE